MKIELKALKYSDFASQETHCFQANIYIDGIKRGTADNDGRGGMTSIHPWQLEKEIKRFTDTLPPEVRHYGGETMTFEVTPDGYIDELVTLTLHEKDLKRGLKNKILFARDGKVYETKRLTAAEMTASFLDPKIKEKLKTEKILNLMQFDQALKLYVECTK
jgi:hypothetical protein